jgi:hypothetical protein
MIEGLENTHIRNCADTKHIVAKLYPQTFFYETVPLVPLDCDNLRASCNRGADQMQAQCHPTLAEGFRMALAHCSPSSKTCSLARNRIAPTHHPASLSLLATHPPEVCLQTCLIASHFAPQGAVTAPMRMGCASERQTLHRWSSCFVVSALWLTE